MAALKASCLSVALSSSCWTRESSYSGIAICGNSRSNASLCSDFSGSKVTWRPASQFKSSAPSRLPAVVSEAVVQFIRGTDESTVPDVRLTRARDGSSGTATFVFDEPSILENLTELGDITGFYMIDDEGTIQSVDLSCQFVDGKPTKIIAKHVMRSEREWDRFMRFMERYAESAGLGFTKK